MRIVKLVLLITILLALSCTTNSLKLFNQGRLDEACKLSRLEFARDSTNVSALLIIGKCFSARSVLDSAEIIFQSIVDRFPDNKDGPLELIQVKKELVLNFISVGDDRNALGKLYEILHLNARDVEALETVGDLFFKSGQHNKAKTQYLAVLAIDSTRDLTNKKIQTIDMTADSAEHIVNDAFDALHQENYQKAEVLFSQALRVKPDHVEAKYGLHIAKGLYLYKRGDVGELWEAIAQFGLAAVLKPTLAEPHYHMARAYEKKDRDEFDNAIQEYETALQLEPDGKYARKCAQKSRELRTLQRKLLDFWGK